MLVSLLLAMANKFDSFEGEERSFYLLRKSIALSGTWLHVMAMINVAVGTIQILQKMMIISLNFYFK